MQISKLSNAELLVKTKSQYLVEVKSMTDMLLYIQEVDRRRAYLDERCTSIFEFLIKLGYTGGSAQRRIDAARMMGYVPDLKENLDSGSLNLMQISMVAKSVRSKQKGGVAVNVEEVFDKIKNENLDDTQVILAREFDLEVKTVEKTRIQKDESVRVEMTFTKEEMELLRRLRDLKSHSNPGASLRDLFLSLAQNEIKRKDPLEKKITAKMAVKPSRAAARKITFKRDKCCQWKDPRTGAACGSTFQLQVDHIKSRWRGGKDDLSNFQILCGPHNRLKYRLEI